MSSAATGVSSGAVVCGVGGGVCVGRPLEGGGLMAGATEVAVRDGVWMGMVGAIGSAVGGNVAAGEGGGSLHPKEEANTEISY